MLKKVFVGIVLVGLSAVLIAGAANRTSDRQSRSSAEGQAVQTGNIGRNAKGGNAVQGSRGRGVNGGDRDASLAQSENSNGFGQGRNAGAGEALALSQNAVEHAWVQFEGMVASEDEDALTVTLDSGESILIEGRAWSFAREMGFAAEAGDRVALYGFFEDEAFEIGELANLTSDQIVLLREESGRPMWAGRGRRGG